MVLLLTVVCLAFYLARPLSDRNYGGVASGFRWVFWCTPLWLLTLLPAADALSRSRRGRMLGLDIAGRQHRFRFLRPAQSVVAPLALRLLELPRLGPAVATSAALAIPVRTPGGGKRVVPCAAGRRW